jgi:hypothetical protein
VREYIPLDVAYFRPKQKLSGWNRDYYFCNRNRDAPVFITPSAFSSALSSASLDMIWLVLRY